MCDTMEFDESKHPRDKYGKFTGGNGEKWGSGNAPRRPKPFTWMDRETLQSEVIKKNASGKGLYPTDFAFTANHFVIYKNKGDCFYEKVVALDLEIYKKVLPMLREAIENGRTFGTAKDVRAAIRRIRSSRR